LENLDSFGANWKITPKKVMFSKKFGISTRLGPPSLAGKALAKWELTSQQQQPASQPAMP
jgi:hypothetical protein